MDYKALHVDYKALYKRQYQKRQKYQRERMWRLRGIKLTWEQYHNMLSEQEGKCAICRALPKNKSLHVDHNHDTGYVRGLLCFVCNRYLTHVGEQLLIDALNYLGREHQTAHSMTKV